MGYKQTLHTLSSTLHLTDTGLELYSKVTDWPDWPTVDPEIREFNLDTTDTKGKVLLPLIQGENGWVNVYQYCIIAHALRLRGYEPLLVVCDGELDMCLKKSKPSDQFSCNKCQFRTKKLIERFGLEATYLSDISCDIDPDSIIERADDLKGTIHNNIEVGSFAMSSTVRFFHKKHINLENPEEKQVFTFFLRAAIMLAERMETLISGNDVIAASATNPAYNSSGIALQIAKSRGIPTTVFATGISPEKIIIAGENLTNVFISDPEYLTSRLSTPLTPEQQSSIKKMMDGRVDGSTVRIKWAGKSDSHVEIADPYQINVGLFTNLMWDASLETDQATAFDNAFNWVQTTIEYFEAKPSQNLIIKTHPAEAVRSTNEGMSRWINEHFDSLPDNVMLLEPDTEVSPYKLADQIDVATVWNSTVGIEMAYFGIPTIVAGNAHYRDWGFTYDAVDSETYHGFFHDFPLEMDEEMRSRAKRYAYHHFIEKQIYFPFHNHTVDQLGLKDVSSDELRPGKENIDAIVEAISEGKIPDHIKSV